MYTGWVKVTGPFDICHFFTHLPIHIRILSHMGWGGGGGRYTSRSNFSYLDCCTAKIVLETMGRCVASIQDG